MGFTQTKDQSGVAVLQVEGQLIVGNRQELKDLVTAALDRGERRILIDFSRTGSIDSSGLGALVSGSARPAASCGSPDSTRTSARCSSSPSWTRSSPSPTHRNRPWAASSTRDR